MSLNLKHVLARAAALTSVGLVAATLAWAQTGASSGSSAPPSTGNSPTGGTRSPSTSGSPTGGSNIDTAEGETPDATRPGVSAAKPPRLGSSGTVPGIGSRSRNPDTDTSDSGATNGVRSTTRSTLQSERDTTGDSRDSSDDFRDAARETRSDARQDVRDTRSDARETADEFRDAARDTTREGREFGRDTAEDARERADNFRDEARDTARDAREFGRDTRRDARDTAEDFRDAARDTAQGEDRSDRFSEREFDRERSRLTDREFDRESDQFNREDQFSERGRDRFTESDARLDREQFNDRDALRDSDRSTVTRDSRFRDSRSRSSSDFRVDSIRPADIGLWFDRETSDGLVINDIGTGVISRWGFREGDRIFSVNGVQVDSQRAFIDTLFDPRWRDQRASVVIYRHGRPWTVYMYPSQLVSEYSSVATYGPLEEYGLVLDDRYDDYVVVWRVLPRSPAYYAGLRPGDVITTFDGRRLTGRDDFVRWMGRGDLDSVVLDINRNRQSRRIDFDLSQAGGFTSGARTSLRPDVDAAGRFDGTLDGRFNDGTGAQFDSRTDTRFDSRPGTQFDSRTDADFDSRVRTPSGTIPNRLRGSASGTIDSDAGVIQPGTIRGTTSDGIQGTVQPRGVLPGVRGAIQGGVRGGGLFRGNR